jgi:hypothetical protein
MNKILLLVALLIPSLANAGFVSGAVGGAVAGAVVSSSNSKGKSSTASQKSREVAANRTILICSLDKGRCYDSSNYKSSKEPLKYAGSFGFKKVHSQTLVTCDIGYEGYCLLMEVSK